MAKPELSMKPTGWFQVAWSAEIETGAIHKMKYFDQEFDRLARQRWHRHRHGRLL